jgi:hypothetical protein
MIIKEDFDDDDDNFMHLGLGSRFLGFGFRVLGFRVWEGKR